MKYDISILVPGMPFDGDTLTTRSLGGSETAGLCMARELSRNGHSVKMFCNTEEQGSYDGVDYSPAGMWQSYAVNTPHDIAIVQRAPQIFLNRTAARLNIAWCHDLALGRQYAQFAATTWNIDEVFVLSEFMKMQYASVYDIDDEFVWTTRNGIDLHYFPTPSPTRNRKRLVYAARPERGLDVMLDRVFPALLERDPDFELALFGYDNPVDHMKGFYAEIADKCRAFGDKVRHMGTLSKPELYREYAESGIYVYPTPSPKMTDFAEISCISVMEAMAAGMPVVCSAEGALVETLGLSAGTLVAGAIRNDDMALKVFVNAVLRFANDPEAYDAASRAGLSHAKKLSWSSVAREWGDHFDELMDRRNDDRTRLAHHFYRRSDIFAAFKAIDGVGTLPADRLRTRMAKEYDFANSDAKLAKHYRKAGRETDKRLTDMDAAKHHDFTHSDEARFRVFENILTGKPEIETIYDYGCGHGWCDVYLHNRIGRRWHGVDIDPGAIKWSRKFADTWAKRSEDLHFEVVGDNAGKRPTWAREEFDCAIVSEVLEHCIDPFRTLTEVESRVKKGGTMLVTVPYGPSEYGTPNWTSFRNHLWEFDLHDLREMFAGKRNISIMSNIEKLSDVTAEPTGFNLIAYEVDHTPIAEIDWTRKLRLQRPRQTVSVFLMAGHGAELTMRWTLNSVRWIADEIVVADTGMNEAGLQACRDYGAIVVPSVDPKTNGFEVPRNHGLDACSMDWAIWIDTDECMTNPQYLTKYLRQSQFNGFSINQHHFTVEGGFNPDQPVRAFRRAPYKGETMRFYGCVTPDTLVSTNPGLKRIDEVDIGEFVRTHDGSYGAVDKIWKYDTNDELLEIIAVGMPEPLKITKDHELYAIRTEKCHYDHDYDVRCKPICRKSEACPHRFFEHYTPEKVRAADLSIGDWLLYPIDNAVVDRDTVKFSDRAREGRRSGKGAGQSWRLDNGQWSRSLRGETSAISDEQPVTGELLRLAGYYVSDGGAHEGKVTFSFAVHERDYAEDVAAIALALGINAVIKRPRRDNMISVKIGCRIIAEWLSGEFGSGAHMKKAPLWLMRLPMPKQQQFLLGLWRGDGNVSGSLVRYTTASNALAHQVQELLLRQGVMANIRYGKAAKAFEVFARIKRARFLDWDMPDQGPNVPSQSWADDRYVYMRVKSIRPFQYQGPVYDLRVPGNHSFVFGHVAGSNCIHEHPELGMNEGPGRVLVLPDVQIAHIGYLSEHIRRHRFARNRPLLLKDMERYPERLLQKHFRMRDNQLLTMYELQANGNTITDEMRERARETVELYREFFIGKPIYSHMDPAEYYSQALRILNEGTEISFNIGVNRDGVGDDINGASLRVADLKEAQTILDSRLRQKFDPISKECW